MFSNWPSPRIRHNALSKNVPVERWSERERAIGQEPRLFERESVNGVVIFLPAMRDTLLTQLEPHIREWAVFRPGVQEPVALRQHSGPKD